MRSSIISTVVSILMMIASSSESCGGIKTNGITVVRLEGTGEVYIDTVPNRADPVNGEGEEAWCFDVDIVRVETGKRIGKGTDCLIVEVDDAECGTLSVTGTTIFDEGEGNVIVARGETTVQPTASDSSLDFTHITGAIPLSTEKNSVLYGTGKFKHSAGPVRLSGAVNMAQFNPGSNPSGSITFNCLFVLDLTTNKYGGTGNSKYYAVQQESVNDDTDNLDVTSNIDSKDDGIWIKYRYIYMIIAGILFVNIMIGIWCYYRNKRKSSCSTQHQYTKTDVDDSEIEEIEEL